MKKTKIAACLSMALLLSGCTVLLWGGNKVVETHSVTKLQIQDNVIGAFNYSNVKLSASRGSLVTPVDIPSEGVAFLGEKNVYIIVRGTDELLSLDKNINNLPMVSSGQADAIKFRLKKQDKNDVIIRFEDTLTVDINKKVSELSAQEKEIAEQLGFHVVSEIYTKNISLQGVIIPRESFKYSFDNVGALGDKYKVEFYSPDSEINFSLEKLTTNIVITPVALAADIVFFPISIQFLRLLSRPDWG